jgi:hypothetical protein
LRNCIGHRASGQGSRVEAPTHVSERHRADSVLALSWA